MGCSKKTDNNYSANKLTLSITPWTLEKGVYQGLWTAKTYVPNQLTLKNGYIYRCFNTTATDPELLIAPYWQKLGAYYGDFNSVYTDGYPNGGIVRKDSAMYISNLAGNRLPVDAAAVNRDILLKAPTVYVAWWGDSFVAGTGATSGSNLPYALSRITGFNVYNGGVGSETSTQIRKRFFADTARWKYPTIIWAGRNNYADMATVEGDISAMVTALGHQRFIVLGIVKKNYQTDTQIDTLNTHLKNKYGPKFIDMQSFLFNQYNPNLPQDVAAHAAGNNPWSLHFDWLHPNNEGYLLIAQYISTKMP
jgi:hypothetical protein